MTLLAARRIAVRGSRGVVSSLLMPDGTVVTWSGEGNPFYPGPSLQRAWLILSTTDKHADRVYWRRLGRAQLHRLETPEDYAEYNNYLAEVEVVVGRI